MNGIKSKSFSRLNAIWFKIFLHRLKKCFYGAEDKSQKRKFIELMCIFGVITIVMLIAVLGRIRFGFAKNEASASGALKTIAAAQLDYLVSGGGDYTGYACKLSDLIPDGKYALKYISEDLVDGNKSGYYFILSAGNKRVRNGVVSYHSWSAEAHPVVYGVTGIRSFYIDSDGILLGADIKGFPGNKNLPEI